MSWNSILLSDIADFSNGVNFDKSSYTKGVKLIGVSNFGERFYPNYDELEEIKTDVVRPNDYLQEGDIVFVRSNGNKELVGRCMMIANPPSKVTYSGFCIRCRIKDTSYVLPKFLTYYFKSTAFRNAISGSAIGANIQNLSQGKLASHRFLIPDINIQRRIASILSAYDDLIENNRRQIKLLEESAQRLYRKWFVELRFPGHESVKVVDGVPEGWKIETVGSLLRKLPRTKQILTSDYQVSGNIPIVDQSRDFIAGYTNDADACVKPQDAIIVFGDHTRILKYITFPFAKGADGTQLIVSNSDCMPQSLFYFSIIHIDLTNYHYARHFKYLKESTILVPTKSIANAYDNIVHPIMKRIQVLRDSCVKAKEARDRLLPILMNREMEISE